MELQQQLEKHARELNGPSAGTNINTNIQPAVKSRGPTVKFSNEYIFTDMDNLFQKKKTIESIVDFANTLENVTENPENKERLQRIETRLVELSTLFEIVTLNSTPSPVEQTANDKTTLVSSGPRKPNLKAELVAVRISAARSAVIRTFCENWYYDDIESKIKNQLATEKDAFSHSESIKLHLIIRFCQLMMFSTLLTFVIIVLLLALSSVVEAILDTAVATTHTASFYRTE